MKKTKTPFTRGGARGVSLLEILIALLIASVMLISITSFYGNFVKSSKAQNTQSLAQDQVNFAFLGLNRAVRMAGAGICVKPTIKTDKYVHQFQDFDFAKTVPALQDVKRFNASTRFHILHGATARELGLSDQFVTLPNSDALLVIYSDSNTRRITGVVDTNGLSFGEDIQKASFYHNRQLASAIDPKKKDIVFYTQNNAIAPTWVMISDCEHTGIFRYTAERFNDVSNHSILPSPDSDKGFQYNFSGNGKDSLMSRVHAKLFFVAKKQGEKTPNLYVRDLLSPDPDPKEIASNIWDMKIAAVPPIAGAKASTPENPAPVKMTLTTYLNNQYIDKKDFGGKEVVEAIHANTFKDLTASKFEDIVMRNGRPKPLGDLVKDPIDLVSYSRILDIRN